MIHRPSLSLLAVVVSVACAPVDEIEMPETVMTEIGSDRGQGNVIGIETFMRTRDYASEEAFLDRLDGFFSEASAHFSTGTVVILPEYIGTWLVAVDEGPATIDADTTSNAMLPLIAGNFPTWLGHRGEAPATDTDTYAVFATKAPRMAEVYARVMGTLAERYAVTLVAGSINLPGPRVDDGVIVTSPGAPLGNASFVFGPDGALIGPSVIKVFPTKSEQGFLTAGEASELPVFDTPAGRVAVLICADAWYPESYAALLGRDVDVIAVPVFVDGTGKWDEPWGGYSGHDAPADVDGADVGVLSEGEAWAKYALPGRAHEAGVTTGLTVPLRGTLWDLTTDGTALAVHDGAPVVLEGRDAPAVVTLWR
jgi:hypothetical protein